MRSLLPADEWLATSDFGVERRRYRAQRMSRKMGGPVPRRKPRRPLSGQHPLFPRSKKLSSSRACPRCTSSRTIFHQLVSIGRAHVRRPVRSIGKSAWTNIVFLRIGTRLCLPAACGALRSVLKTNAFFRFSPRQCRIFVPNRYRQHTHSPREREARRQKRGRALSSARPLLICGRA